MTTRLFWTLCKFVFVALAISFSTVACAPSSTDQANVVAVQPMSDTQIEETEKNFSFDLIVDPSTSQMTEYEKNNLLNMEVQWTTAGNATAASVNLIGMDLNPQAMDVLLRGTVEQSSTGVYNLTSFHYVFAHFTNHMDKVGINVNDVGRAGAYTQQVIKSALEGNGLIFKRTANAVYENGYYLVSKVNGSIWGVWVDEYGRPITGFLQNQKTLPAVERKLISDGLSQITAQQVPQIIKDKWWTGVPTTIRFYVWGAQRFIEYQASMNGINVGQVVDSVLAGSMMITPPIPLIVNPCLLAPSMEICKPSGSDSNT